MIAIDALLASADGVLGLLLASTARVPGLVLASIASGAGTGVGLLEEIMLYC